MEEHALWVQRYSELQSAEGFRVEFYFRPGWTYSAKAYALFPRYRLAEETLLNIESLSFESGIKVEEARSSLLMAGRKGYDSLCEEFVGKDDAIAALTSQAVAYEEFIENITHEQLEAIIPLPFRRVLNDQESGKFWQTLSTQWKIKGSGHGWFPLTNDAPPPGTLTFHADLWKARNGGAVLQDFLFRNGVDRCVLLRELGPPDFELDRSLVSDGYDGSESFLLSDSGWVLYFSHESSLTLAGTLADFFRRTWEDAEELSYRGPFHTTDLRGSWNG